MLCYPYSVYALVMTTKFLSSAPGWRIQDEPNLLWSLPVHTTRKVCHRHVSTKSYL